MALGVLCRPPMKRFFLIGLIWAGCAAAWMILGATILVRTGETSDELLEEVYALWGRPIEQGPASASWSETQKVRRQETRYSEDGEPREVTVLREELVSHPLPLVSTRASAHLALEQRRKGLLWFPTYAVDFEGRYAFQNAAPRARDVELSFPIPEENAGLDGFSIQDSEGKPVPYEIRADGAHFQSRFGPGEKQTFDVSFRTRGTSRWTYVASGGTGQVRDLELAVTADFPDIDFPAGTLSPTRHKSSDGGWSGTWAFESLVSSQPIGIELPQRLNPGVVASRITFFAPVGLLFFFFVVSILAAAQRRALPLASYFFFGAAFFAFHLLFAYLVDHLAILPSFTIASATSVLLVVTYARLFAGWRFSLREMGISQLLYLVLFSVTFFWDGFTGLAIAIGAVLTLFAMMQLTGRLEHSALPSPGAPAPGAPLSGTPIASALPGIVGASGARLT